MARLVDCFPSIHEALQWFPSTSHTGCGGTPVIPALGRWRQGTQRFKEILTLLVRASQLELVSKLEPSLETPSQKNKIAFCFFMLKPHVGTKLLLILLFCLHKVRFLIAAFLQPYIVNVRTYKETKYTVRIRLHRGALVEQQACPC